MKVIGKELDLQLEYENSVLANELDFYFDISVSKFIYYYLIKVFVDKTVGALIFFWVENIIELQVGNGCIIE